MILANANHDPVTADFFDVEIGMGERQSNDRCINLAFENFLGQLRCVSMSGAYSDSREQLSMQRAEAAKKALIHEWGRSEANHADFAPLDGHERVDDFLANLKNQSS